MQVRLLGSVIVATDDPSFQGVTFWTRTPLDEDAIAVSLWVPAEVADDTLHLQLSSVDAVAETLRQAAQAYEPDCDGDTVWHSETPILYSSISYRANPTTVPCIVCQQRDEQPGLSLRQPMDVDEVAECFVHIDCTERFCDALCSVYDHTHKFLSSSL